MQYPSPSDLYSEFSNNIKSGNFEKNTDPSLYSTIPRIGFEGYKLNKGKWSLEEDNLLIENWKKYLDDYPWIIGNESYLFMSAKSDFFKEINNLIRKTGLYERLGRGINRGIKNVYWRAKKCLLVKDIFDSKPINKEDIKQALKLYEEHGNHFGYIAQFFNRRPDYIRGIILKNLTQPNLFVWSPLEEKTLILCVFKIKFLEKFKVTYPSLYKSNFTYHKNADNLINQVRLLYNDIHPLIETEYINFPWSLTPQIVTTRTSKQCRSHWLDTLLPRLLNSPEQTLASLNTFDFQEEKLPDFSGSSSDLDIFPDEDVTIRSEFSSTSYTNGHSKTKEQFNDSNTCSTSFCTTLNTAPRLSAKISKDVKVRLLLTLKMVRHEFPLERDIDWNFIASKMDRKPCEVPHIKILYRRMRKIALKAGCIRLKAKSWNNLRDTPKVKIIIPQASVMSLDEFKQLPESTKSAVTKLWLEEVFPFKRLINKLCKKYARYLEVYQVKQIYEKELEEVSII